MMKASARNGKRKRSRQKTGPRETDKGEAEGASKRKEKRRQQGLVGLPMLPDAKCE